MGPKRKPVVILVVEDDVRSARVLARLLREDGFHVEIATDGAAAINRLSHAPIPDVLLTDLRIPHADGLAVARYARSLRRDLPVFLVTGYPELAAPTDGGLDPEPFVLAKPLDYAELTTKLRGLVPN